MKFYLTLWILMDGCLLCLGAFNGGGCSYVDVGCRDREYFARDGCCLAKQKKQEVMELHSEKYSDLLDSTSCFSKVFTCSWNTGRILFWPCNVLLWPMTCFLREYGCVNPEVDD